MRLLNTRTLELKEFFDYELPKYAILSHRWGSMDQELSYNDWISGLKRTTTGCAKIHSFCELAERKGFAYCWIDTCCIDKSSSSEVSEAILSMYDWYQRAQVCFAYLADVSDTSELPQSDWFFRGWTLQELIAPVEIVFRNRDWDWIGTRSGLQQEIALATGIDRALLVGEKGLDWYSNAQIMSWAANRLTSKLEDQAYCLLGLFGVSMPLYYGEGAKAFRRLQETIMTQMEDNSLFLWGPEAPKHANQIGDPSILASSPRQFAGCQDIGRGFSSQRIQFENTNQGVMVSLHHSYDRDGLDALLHMAEVNALPRGHTPPPVGLTIPLGSYRRSCLRDDPDPNTRYMMESYFLQLVQESGKWRRVGVVSQYSEMFWQNALHYQAIRHFAYSSDYVRIYLHHNRDTGKDFGLNRSPEDIQYLHLQDASLASVIYEMQTSDNGAPGMRVWSGP